MRETISAVKRPKSRRWEELWTQVIKPRSESSTRFENRNSNILSAKKATIKVYAEEGVKEIKKLLPFMSCDDMLRISESIHPFLILGSSYDRGGAQVNYTVHILGAF